VNPDDSPEAAMGYLDRAVGNRAPRGMREAFVLRGPAMLRALEALPEIKFRVLPFHPDYLYELEGSTACGRALEPLPFDGATLGDDLALIRPPIPEMTILNGMMIDRDDIPHLLKMKKSLRSLMYSVRIVGSHYVQKMRHGRGTRLLMGNALIGRFLAAARRLGVDIVTQAQVLGIEPQEDGGHRLVLADGRTVLATKGVILASGGFGRHPIKRVDMLPSPTTAYSPAAPGHTGELHDIVLGMGAHYSDTAAQTCYWAPVSVRTRADGTTAAFPHFVLDRSKPGIVSVGRDGLRFVNESRSYHEFVSAMFAANTGDSHIPAFLIADAVAVKKYGLGMIRPGEKTLTPHLSDGYLVSAPTLAELAGKLDIQAAGLITTVERMNQFAKTGVDEDFHRGETVYERGNGDPTVGPNPTLGMLKTGPFYAVRLYPGDIGAATGLMTNDNAQLIRRDGSVIDGLFACGADMNSIMGGVYPGPGITIGPGIVFGSIAARAAMGVDT
jgi:succinate dehydrogenase/fumarate reductase flavoprotein subunit